MSEKQQNNTDKFQERYLAHREYKSGTLNGLIKEPPFKPADSIVDVIKNRRSRRVYKSGVSDKCVNSIIEISKYAPSSCNRKAVFVKPISTKLSNMLIGAKGWHKKGTVLAIYADNRAYKSEWEKSYMPYLDAGVVAQTILLYCESKRLKACFINPNTHGKYKGKNLFCGAIAVGK